MCDFTTLLSIGGSVMGLIGQQQQNRAQEEANQRQYDATMRNYRANLAQVELEKQQNADLANQKITENNLKAREATATAFTAAGENGVSGLSVDALVADLGMKQGTYNSSVRTNYSNTITALDNQRENVYANAASQINSLKIPTPVDYLGAATKIGTAGYTYGKSQNWWA